MSGVITATNLQTSNIKSATGTAAITIADNGLVSGAGKIIGYHQQAYTDNTSYSDSDLGTGSEVTLASPLNGTWNYTTVKANSTLRFTLQICPIRHQSTWTNNIIKTYYSTSGSGGSYTLFGINTQWGYTANSTTNEHAFHLTAILSSIAAATQINVKATVERAGGSVGGAAGFHPNKYYNNSGDITTGSEFVSNSFLEVMEIG